MYSEELESLIKSNNYTVLENISEYPDEILEYYIPHESIALLPNKIPKFKSYNFVFGAMDSNVYDPFREIGNVHVFPTYWLYELIRQITGFGDKFNFKKLGICMNYVPKLQRRYMMKYLDEFNLLDSFEWSWQKTEKSEIIFEREGETKTLSDSLNSDNHMIGQWNIPKEYYNTFIDLVNETHQEIPFITEKTYKPLLLGKPFIVNGCMGFHTKYLKDLGFELYDEIIDYSFDLKTFPKRQKEIANQLSKLKNEDFDKLYSKIYDKIKYNQNRVFSIIENREWIPDVILKTTIPHYQYVHDVINVDEKMGWLKEKILV